MPVPILMLLFVPFQVYSAMASNMPANKIVGTYAILISCVFLFAVQAAFWSWLFRRTSVAISAAYGTVFVLTAGTGLVEILLQIARDFADTSPVMWLNPFYVMGIIQGEPETWAQIPAMDIARLMCAVYVGAGIILLIVMKNGLERTRTE